MDVDVVGVMEVALRAGKAHLGREVLDHDLRAVERILDAGRLAGLQCHLRRVADLRPQAVGRRDRDGVRPGRQLDELEASSTHPESRSLVADVREQRKVFAASFAAALKQMEAGNDQEASRLIVGETLPALETILATMDRLLTAQGHEVLDLGTGVWAALGCLAALQKRHLTGEGCVVDTSLLEARAVWGDRYRLRDGIRLWRS